MVPLRNAQIKDKSLQLATFSVFFLLLLLCGEEVDELRRCPDLRSCEDMSNAEIGASDKGRKGCRRIRGGCRSVFLGIIRDLYCIARIEIVINRPLPRAC